MGVNAYSKGPVAPAFQSNYISQHTGLPLEYIGAALQAKQEKYDHFLQGVNGLGTDLMGIQGIVPSDAAYVAKAREGYNKQLEELYQQDGTRPEVQRAYQNLVHSIAGDKNLNAIKANYAQLGEKQAQAQKLKADGKYHYSHGQLQTRALQEYEANGGAAEGASLQLEDFTPEVDVMKEYNDIYNVMKPSERDALGMLAAGDDGAIAYKMSHGGIDAQQAFQTARAALETHRNSQAGRQKFLDAKAMGATDAQAHAYVAQQLYSRGGAYTFSKSSTNADGALNKIGDIARAKKAKKAEAEPVFMPYGQMKPNTGKEVQFTPEGNVDVDPGMWESAGARISAKVKEQEAMHGADAVIRKIYPWVPLGEMINAGVKGMYDSWFGDEPTKKALAEQTGYHVGEVQKGAALYNQIAAQMGRPGISEQEYYQTRNVFEPSAAPTFSTNKEYQDAQARVKSGILAGSVIHDADGEHQYNDLIKEDDTVTITSNPAIPWGTKFSPNTVGITITGKDGKTRQGFVDNSAQYDYINTPRTEEEVKAKNARLENKARFGLHAEGDYWKWDAQNKRAIYEGRKKGIYHPNLGSRPVFGPAD